MTFATFTKRFLLVAFVTLLLVALWFFRNTLLLGFLATVLAVGISIPANWLIRRRWPRALANVTAALSVGIVALFLLLWLLPTIAAELGGLLASLPQGVENLAGLYNSLLERSETLARVLPAIEPGEASLSEEEIRQLFEGVVNNGLPILVSGGGVAFNFLTNFILVVFLALLFLADPTAYVKASLYLVPESYRLRMTELWGELYKTLKTWLSALFISISITVTLVLVILGLLGMPNVLVVAVFAGFATFVPNIGAFLPIIPITIFTLADDPVNLFAMVPAYLAIQLVESNVLTPLIVKRELNIPAAGMLLVQIIAGLIFGLLGLLLAVPLLAVVITLVRELYSYDVLGLRGRGLEVSLDKESKLSIVSTKEAVQTKKIPRHPEAEVSSEP